MTAEIIASTPDATKVVARAPHHFFSLRCCRRAQWEIRDLANEMLRQCRRVAPVLFELTPRPRGFMSTRSRPMPCFSRRGRQNLSAQMAALGDLLGMAWLFLLWASEQSWRYEDPA